MHRTSPALPPLAQANERLDVLIVGAGLSGIGAAYYVQKHLPKARYAILESRSDIGGTWDLFRYPGIRSDSDMQTLGFSFRPWSGAKTLADGPSILEYIKDTAREYGIDRNIRFQHEVIAANWDSEVSLWTVEVRTPHSDESSTYQCRFLYICAGYYDYAEGHQPVWEGADSFDGRIIHPQYWPEDLDYTDKTVVVIGSGATAVTIAPVIARTSAHVTVLQRSPTYIASRPARDKIANALHRLLPGRVAHAIVRWKNILTMMAIYGMARLNPKGVKAKILKLARAEVGPDFDVEAHLTPTYNPWDQRLCLAPDGDFFSAIRAGKVSMVTDHLATFTPTGLTLASGKTLPADIVVTATGLNIKLLGGMTLNVDGVAVNPAQHLIYKGAMLEGVPNFAYAFGYTNASWTLKCELVSRYVTRLLKSMNDGGYDWCMPDHRAANVEEEDILGLTSGYVQRAIGKLPRQGSRRPWRMYQNYILDLATLRLGSVSDGVMTFGRARTRTPSTIARN
jgi:cation diffusion facilitator CzcD-associated flavoprotein CzcO